MQEKHPKGLWVLMCGEMFDRFTYYGIATIMTLYLAKVFLYSDNLIYSTQAVYSTLGFGLPVLGGLVADKILGYQRSVMLGALLIIFGNAILLMSGLTAIFAGLSLVVVGIGLFKANITSQLGTLYPLGDERKEGAFAIFYFGMNIGALSGPIAFGLAVYYFGWHAGFILNIIGMSISLIWYLASTSYFKQYLTHEKHRSAMLVLLFFVCLLITIYVVGWVFAHPNYFNDFVWLFALFMALAICYVAYRRPTADRRNILAYVIFVIFSLFYFACSRQVNTSLLLFIDRVVDRHVFGFMIPTEWFSSITPIFIALSLLAAGPIWNFLGRRKRQPSPMTLVTLGLFLGALSFVIFSLAAHVPEYAHWNVRLYLLFFGFFVLGCGELVIIPTVTSMVTELAPKNLQATFMGFWFLSSAFSAYVGAIMAKLSDVTTLMNNVQATSDIYAHAFMEIAGIVFVSMLLSLIAIPIVKKLIVHD